MTSQPLTSYHWSEASAILPKDTPICQINLLRFRKTAQYPNHPELASPQVSGYDAFLERYIPAVQAIQKEMGFGDTEVKFMFQGAPVASILGEQWDAMNIVQFPSFERFEAFLRSDEYRTRADPHRTAALESQALLATVEIPIGGR